MVDFFCISFLGVLLMLLYALKRFKGGVRSFMLFRLVENPKKPITYPLRFETSIYNRIKTVAQIDKRTVASWMRKALEVELRKAEKAFGIRKTD